MILLTTLIVILAVSIVCVWYDLRHHKTKQRIQESYEERVQLAKQGVEVGLCWTALRQSDEIRVYEAGMGGGSYFITREQVKEVLMRAKAREYDMMKVREEKYKADIKEKDITLKQWSDRAHELMGLINKLETNTLASQYTYTTSSNQFGKKSKGKKK